MMRTKDRCDKGCLAGRLEVILEWQKLPLESTNVHNNNEGGTAE